MRPGVLGSTAVFKNTFSDVIALGRDSKATREQMELSNERMKSLQDLASQFVLRRDASVNQSFLPKMHGIRLSDYLHVEIILFCPYFTTSCESESAKADSERHDLYRSIASNALTDIDGRALRHITQLKKLVNSTLLVGNLAMAVKVELGLQTLTNSSPKMRCLVALLTDVIIPSNTGLVLVSNYTSTLDLLARCCELVGLEITGRLDGSTDTSKRQAMIDSFNRGKGSRCFLLSSKAGGVGINLIGACTMVYTLSSFTRYYMIPIGTLRRIVKLWLVVGETGKSAKFTVNETLLTEVSLSSDCG